MEILFFKTNITSPIGIQAVWDSLKSLGVHYFVIDFIGIDNTLRVMCEQIIPTEKIIEAISNLGYSCEELNF
jgi:hypothetical protein